MALYQERYETQPLSAFPRPSELEDGCAGLEKHLGPDELGKMRWAVSLARAIGTENGAEPFRSHLWSRCFSSGSYGRRRVPVSPAPTPISSDSFAGASAGRRDGGCTPGSGKEV